MVRLGIKKELIDTVRNPQDAIQPFARVVHPLLTGMGT